MMVVLGQLAERDRLVLTLRYLEGLPYREVSRELGCPAHQARALCHRALRRLRRRLAEPSEEGTGPRRCRDESAAISRSA